MKISVVLIGNELLDGRIVDQNLKTLSNFIVERGGSIRDVSIVNDSIDDICDAFDRALEPIVVVSGGLGPTKDDMTRLAAAKFAHQPLVEDLEVTEQIRQRFAAEGRNCPEINRNQAMRPQGASWIPNPTGTAPGFSLPIHSPNGTKTLYSFPGVPREFAAMSAAALDTVIPEIDRHRSAIYVFGISESRVAELIEPFPDSVQIGYRAMDHFIEVKISGDPTDVVSEMVRIADILQDYRLAIDSTVEAEIGRILSERNETLAVAESCTSGLLAAKITEVSGASNYFIGGMLTYANSAKVELVGVSQSTLDSVGAVSRDCAAQLADGVSKRLNSSWGLSISGIAGPSGGSVDKPVGYVCFGVAGPNGICTMVRNFGDLGRDRIRNRSVVAILHLFLCILEGRNLPPNTEIWTPSATNHSAE